MKYIYILVISVISFMLLSCIAVTPTPESETKSISTVTPLRNSYTGMQDVNTIIDALIEQDTDTIQSHVQFIQLPCTHQNGLGGPPKCEEGQEEGTVVEVFPILGTEGFYLTPDTIQGLQPNVSELYAVYE